jgi:hypothetical protein
VDPLAVVKDFNPFKDGRPDGGVAVAAMMWILAQSIVVGGGKGGKGRVRTVSSGGDAARSCWWHITEITLDHLRPSPEWKRQSDELQLAKDCEAEIRKGLKKLQRARLEKEMQLQLVRESFADLPEPYREAGGSGNSCSRIASTEAFNLSASTSSTPQITS